MRSQRSAALRLEMASHSRFSAFGECSCAEGKTEIPTCTYRSVISMCIGRIASHRAASSGDGDRSENIRNILRHKVKAREIKSGERPTKAFASVQQIVSRLALTSLRRWRHSFVPLLRHSDTSSLLPRPRKNGEDTERPYYNQFDGEIEF